MFLREAGREDVASLLAESRITAASQLAWVECRAAFARLRREGNLSSTDEADAGADLDSHWQQFFVIDVNDAVRVSAGELVRTQPLRGADAVHLASAQSFTGRSRDRVRFACFDRRLWNAARALGFETVPATEP